MDAFRSSLQWTAPVRAPTDGASDDTPLGVVQETEVETIRDTCNDFHG